MKRDGKYRFTLGFSGDCPERVRAGELLERLGNRKSTVVVEALNEYLDRRPDLAAARPRIAVSFRPTVDREELTRLIEEVLRTHEAVPRPLPRADAPEEAREEVAQMLRNLGVFDL